MKFSTTILASSFFVSVCFLSCDKKSLPEAPDDPKEEPFQVELFKANRILIKNGLQLQCWVATDNYELGGKEGQPAYNMNPSDWEKTGFTAPTFFGPPLMNLSYFKSFPSSQWAMAKAPYGTHLKSGPTDFEMKEGFLSADQKQYLKKLVSICFGDEENFSVPLIPILKNWIEVVHKHYPDVLAHNNQFAGQWSVADLRSYIQIAHPDLITYDWYYFHSWDNNNYKGARDMAKHLNVYRDLSLEGTSGNKKDYIAFGQYTQGFVNEGTYKITESQLRLYYYMTWTFGGKWLNWFRYLQGDGYGGQTSPTTWALLLENGMPGKPTIHMTWVNQCNLESKNIGDYLVRLKTSDVRYVGGTVKYTEGVPDRVDIFNPSVGFVKRIKGSVKADPDESADLYIGYYDIIPKEEQGDPDFFKNKNAKYFMITNGLVSKTEQFAAPLTQTVVLDIDMSSFNQKKLFCINPQTGSVMELQPSTQNNDVNRYSYDLLGGSGVLFFIQ